VFITNNNPRLESPEDIVSQTIAGFPPHIHAYEVPTLHRSAIKGTSRHSAQCHTCAT
jgi:UDP-N-acetylmuramyl tripeptide synthase